MTLKVSELTIEDAQNFNHTGDKELFVKNMTFNLELPQLRRCYAFKKDGYTVAILGGSWISNGVWEVWLFPAADVQNYAKSLVRELKDFTDWVFTRDVHRLQMAVLEQNKKWAQAIGFQFEGIVKNYHSNKDHFMFIKVGSNGR